MMGPRSTLLVALLMLVPAFAFVPTAEACATSGFGAGVPCGRIYPLILMKIEGQEPLYPAAQGEELVFDAILTYKFSVNDNGYTVALPNEDVVVTFEYPRKPDWVDLKVEPDRIVIPVNDPTNLRPNADDPNNVQVEFSYSTPITVTARLNGQQPVLRDGYDFAKLLVFAKSTESGLYQAGYGIKEIRVAPEGALFESQVAGTRDVFTATPVSQVALAGGAASFAGTTVTVTPPATTTLWQPTPVEVQLDPAPTGDVYLTVTEESGALVATEGPLAAAGGKLTANVTFAHPGRHLAAVTLVPPAGSTAPAASFHVPLTVGDTSAEGFAFPKSYLVSTTQAVPAPGASAADPMTQFERDIPFFAFDTAQSTVASLTLLTPGADALARGATNLQFAIYDADGKQLQVNSVDAANPARSIRIGSLPGDGWYVLRVSGAGAPTLAAYHARIEVAYALAPEARNLADGAMDATGGLLGLGGRNLTLPVENLAVWTPSAFAPALAGFEGAPFLATVTDPAGRVVYASGARSGDASFTPPAPGLYHATVLVTPGAGSVAAPVQRTFTFRVGDGGDTVASAFAVEDVLRLPTSASEGFLGAWMLPTPVTPQATTLDFAAPGTGSMRFVLLDATGAEAATTTSGGALDLDPARGPYTLVAYGANRGPAATVPMTVEEQFGAPVTIRDPDGAPTAAQGSAPIPGLAIAAALAALGLVAVGVAFARRR